MNIIVFFDNEMKSSWLSQALAEYDLAFETLNPYNIRYLFQLELSVDERIREGKSLYLPIQIIKNLWPEVLSEPINPENGLLPKLKKIIIIRKFFFRIIRNFRYLKNQYKFRKMNI